MRARIQAGLLVVAVTLASFVANATAGSYGLYASNPDTATIALHWSWWEDPSQPIDRPEWVGFDLLRRSVATCEAFTRVNAETFPRLRGQSFNGIYVDSPPEQGTLYEYRLAPVDGNHNTLSFSRAECEDCYWTGVAWASSPRYSAPVARGVLSDRGWALFLTPCPSSCYPSVYTESRLDELRPHAQSGTPVSLYGDIVCGTVEGCAIRVALFLVQPCDVVVATRRASWGSLKLLYR